MIWTRKCIVAKELPRKYSEMAPIPPPPPVEPTRPIEEAKTVNGKPVNDPLGEEFGNFERALRDRNS